MWSDLPHETWYQETQPEGAPERLLPPVADVVPVEEIPVSAMVPDPLAVQSLPLNPRHPTLLLAQAERSRQVGNQVKAAILRMRAFKDDPDDTASHREVGEARVVLDNGIGMRPSGRMVQDVNSLAILTP